MKKEKAPTELQLIPLDAIEVLNPRERDSKVFAEIVRNIKEIGLKKPITVTPRPRSNGTPRYLLVCGEGRMKAFQELGEPKIPAMVVDVTDEDAFIMSLAENIARRHYRPLELMVAIEQLQKKGYDHLKIAAKTGLSSAYVHGIMVLLEKGELRLLDAVERGKIPLNSALAIVNAGKSSASVQDALQDAYESGALRGKALLEARKIIERRQSLGKSFNKAMARKNIAVSSHSLVKSYQKEVERQKLIVKKAAFAHEKLLFVASAFRQLMTDDYFATLLPAEGLHTLPKYLSERVLRMEEV